MKYILFFASCLLLTTLGAASECPVDKSVIEAVNLSGLVDACGDVSTDQGCDACAYALSSPLHVLLDYVTVDAGTTPNELLTEIDLIRQDCYDLLSPVIIRDVGLFNVGTLLNLRRFETGCIVDPKTYTKTYGSTLDYLESQGVDVSNLKV